MGEDLHDIDDLFKKAIGEHQEAPSPAVWEKLDKDLDKKKVAFISKKYNKLKWVAAALFIFSSSIAMYTWHVKSQIREEDSYVRDGKKKAELRNDIAPAPRAENGDSGESSQKASPAPPGLTDSSAKTNVIAKTDRSGVQTNQSPPADINQHGDSDLTSRAGLENPESDDKNYPDEAKITTRKETAPVKGEEITANSSRDKNASKRNKPANDRSDLTYTPRRRGLQRLTVEKITGQPKDFTAEKNQSNVAKAKTDDVKAKELANLNQPLRPALSLLQLSLFNETFAKGPSVSHADLLQQESAINATVKVSSPQKRPFSITPFYSFDFVSSKVDNNDRRFREDDRKEIKDKETIGNAYTVGLASDYTLSKEWSLETGLALSSMTTTIKPKLIFARPDNMGNVNFRFNCSAGYSIVTLKGGGNPIAGDSIQALSSKNTLSYLIVPLTFRYHFNGEKISVNPGIGLGANFLTRGKIETEIAGRAGNEKLATDHIEGLNSMYMNGSLSIGLDYSISKTVLFSFMPSMRFGLSPINANAPVRTFLNTYSLATGFTIRL